MSSKFEENAKWKPTNRMISSNLWPIGQSRFLAHIPHPTHSLLFTSSYHSYRWSLSLQVLWNLNDPFYGSSACGQTSFIQKACWPLNREAYGNGFRKLILKTVSRQINNLSPFTSVMTKVNSLFQRQFALVRSSSFVLSIFFIYFFLYFFLYSFLSLCLASPSPLKNVLYLVILIIISFFQTIHLSLLLVFFHPHLSLFFSFSVSLFKIVPIIVFILFPSYYSICYYSFSYFVSLNSL